MDRDRWQSRFRHRYHLLDYLLDKGYLHDIRNRNRFIIARNSATIDVSAPALVVTISCPTTGTVGTSVSCNAPATGGTPPYTFSWTATGGSPASGTGTSFSTTYSTKGTYTISVTGTDSSSLATPLRSTFPHLL